MKLLAQTIKALSDPIRLRIVLLLQSEGELCVCDLMAVLKLPQSTVSRHLEQAKRAVELFIEEGEDVTIQFLEA